MDTPLRKGSALAILLLVLCVASLQAAILPGRTGTIRGIAYNGLIAGQRLVPTESLSSPNGLYHLRFQNNGRVALWSGGTRLWTSEPTSASPTAAVMQANGNFVARDAAQAAIWMTDTANHPGAFLAVQDDGIVAIYSADMRVLWSRFGPKPSGAPRK